jgi:hypothetical protein
MESTVIESNVFCQCISLFFFSQPIFYSAGEPLWAEVARLLFRLLFMAVFIIIATVLALQVKNSPVIDQKYYLRQPDSTIDVPGKSNNGWYSLVH